MIRGDFSGVAKLGKKLSGFVGKREERDGRKAGE